MHGDAMDRAIANYTVNALQAVFEACNTLASELPPAKREKVEKMLTRAQQARASIMAELM